MVHVYAFWRNPIFHDSVRVLLQHPQVEWAGHCSDPQTLQREIKTLHPDIVLIEQTEGKEYEEIIEILQSNSLKIKIIAINLDDNQLLVFSYERRTIIQSKDLLQLVLSAP